MWRHISLPCTYTIKEGSLVAFCFGNFYKFWEASTTSEVWHDMVMENHSSTDHRQSHVCMLLHMEYILSNLKLIGNILLEHPMREGTRIQGVYVRLLTRLDRMCTPVNVKYCSDCLRGKGKINTRTDCENKRKVSHVKLGFWAPYVMGQSLHLMVFS